MTHAPLVARSAGMTSCAKSRIDAAALPALLIVLASLVPVVVLMVVRRADGGEAVPAP